ncbi:hypothetical protein JCGZ_01652 [Jatropha curcas]|uniref:Uncharacterized protein n=1 Tax=Jatropha curcas TaxID=180498 RepID=A0A067JJM1_JATCU|nr:hypothetical protein JCGZ_01652 [Jatropha curcas]
MSSLFGFKGKVNARTLSQGRAWWYNRRYSHTNSDIEMFQELLNGLSWDRLLIHVPSPIEFDPFAEAEELDRGQGTGPVQQCGKCVRRGSEPRALDTAVVVGMPEHMPGASFSFILDRTVQPTQGILEMHLVSPYRISPPSYTHMMSIDDYNELCQLYEVACLNLAEARLSDEHISRVDIVPPAGQGRVMWRGWRMGRRAGHQLVIDEETEESGSEDYKETASNMS